MNEKIKQASPIHATLLAEIVSNSNKDVAERFNLNYKNSPKHPSFCTSDWIEEGFQRGVVYFIFELKDKPIGCVAFETPEPGIAYLNRLSVIPSARNAGIGKKWYFIILIIQKFKLSVKLASGLLLNMQNLKNGISR